MVFTKEDELKHVEVKCCVMRMMIQMLRNNEECIPTFVQNASFKNWVIQVATASKNVVLQSGAICLITLIYQMV